MSGPLPPVAWVTIPVAATYLSVSEKTVRRLISDGAIRAERFGKRLIRVDSESLRGIPLGIGR